MPSPENPEINPLSLAVTLLSFESTTEQVAAYMIKRCGSPEKAMASLNDAHRSMGRLVTSIALAIRTTPAPKGDAS